MSLFDEHIQQEQEPVIRVSDGFVFTFSAETLRLMLAHAEKVGKVTVFVRERAPIAGGFQTRGDA